MTGRIDDLFDRRFDDVGRLCGLVCIGLMGLPGALGPQEFDAESK